MAAAGVAFLVRADLLPSWGNRVWDTSAVLDEKSLAGQALHTLVGYADRPSGMQLAAYLAVLALLLLAGRAAAPSRPAERAKAEPVRI